MLGVKLRVLAEFVIVLRGCISGLVAWLDLADRVVIFLGCDCGARWHSSGRKGN